VSQQLGLRERKKQRTRETIVRVAHELFAERGYHATTLPDIYTAAEVSRGTLHAYFPSKEDILFSDLDRAKDALARALAERPAGQDTLETVREFILSPDLLPLREQFVELAISKDPILRSHQRGRVAQLQEVIAPAIALDLGASADDPRAELAAASLIAAFNLLGERGAAKTTLWTAEEIAAQIDPIFTFLRAGLDALK
jgi:AcrR family transcriptional regulator